MRIIAGVWRGRRIAVPDAPGLRPTPDRVRETLFNWLQGRLLGARVLDLYAGTGVLGLEALSRGAGSVLLVERHPVVAAALRQTVTMLGATAASVAAVDAAELLQAGPGAVGGAFDLVLADPPFAAGGQAELCKLLDDRGWLTSAGWVYLEGPSAGEPVALPAPWQQVRALTAGAVDARLFRVGASP